MSETTAPAATTPAAPATTAPTNGATATPAIGTPPAERGPDGKFLPKTEAAPAETPALTQAEKRRLKFKAAGEEIELDEEEAIRRLQMDHGARKKFGELAHKERELQAKQAKLLKPETFWDGAMELGLTREQALVAAENLLKSAVSEAEMSPEQRALSEKERALMEREQKLQEEEQRRQEAADEAEQGETLKLLSAEVPKALESFGFSPKEKGEALDRLVSELREVEAAGEKITVDHITSAMRRIDERMRAAVPRYAKGLKGKALVDFWGPEVYAEWKRYEVERAREARGAVAPKSPEPVMERTNGSQSTYMTPAQLQRELKKAGL